jgi:hypothetical protein
MTTHGPPIPPPPLEHETASLLTVQHSTSRCADRRGIPPPRHQSPRRGTRARAGQRRSESGQRARHRSLSLSLSSSRRLRERVVSEEAANRNGGRRFKWGLFLVGLAPPRPSLSPLAPLLPTASLPLFPIFKINKNPILFINKTPINMINYKM